MSVFSQIADFLPEKTKLMVLVDPSGNSGNIDKEVERFLVSAREVQPLKKGKYVPIHLDEPLKIEFSISQVGNIIRKLKPCKCSTPVLPQEQLQSLNNAYQEISQLLEPHRFSHGGTVYDKVFFQDGDGSWQLLDILREKVYQRYRAEFEEYQRIIKEGSDGYVKPLTDTHNLFALEDKQRKELIKALESKTENLQEQVEQLNALLEKTKLQTYRQKLEEFRERLKADYPETKSPDSWQEWIYKNNWLFGIQYGTPIAHPRVGFRSILDYLFPTPDGFIDILEIKKPSHEVIKEDNSHSGAFRWSGEANEAIGQVVNYLHEIELHQLEIAKKFKQELSLELSTIKPRAFILIGKSDNWGDKEKEAFRRLNHSLHGIEVMTYHDLLRRGENLIKVYGD
ncbi:Shedu anti-phage system protein SduA domain-containing protein [Trichocoleus sp. DQ-U1]|uniref:Shedu anti-phage system protein SduA domain-containing protein n=1 Tax=Trichocoleus sp. DQ-U1 TaxID=2933926 RepID=UPI00329852D3